MSRKSRRENQTKSVFEVYAHEYDLITNAEGRRAPHGREIDSLIAKYSPKTVLDAGCATGLTTALFAERGVNAVGLDRSRTMLRVARKKYSESNLPLSFRYGDFERLPRSLNGKFDLVVCLANSISGVGSVSGLRKALRSFASVLRSDGVLVLQLLNYKSLRQGEIMPIRTTVNEGLVYTRFAELVGRKLNLYVCRQNIALDEPTLEIFRHTFDNFTVEQVLSAVENAPFHTIRKYSNLHLTKRFGLRSRDLVVTARRS